MKITCASLLALAAFLLPHSARALAQTGAAPADARVIDLASGAPPLELSADASRVWIRVVLGGAEPVAGERVVLARLDGAADGLTGVSGVASVELPDLPGGLVMLTRYVWGSALGADADPRDAYLVADVVDLRTQGGMFDFQDFADLPFGTLEPGVGGITDAALADIVGDPNPDLILTLSNGPDLPGQIVVVQNVIDQFGEVLFGPAFQADSIGVDPFSIVAADITGPEGVPDGREDVVVANRGSQDNQIVVFANSPTAPAGLEPVQALSVPGAPVDVAAVLLDFDTVPDIVVSFGPPLAVVARDAANALASGGLRLLRAAAAGPAMEPLSPVSDIPLDDEPASSDGYLEAPARVPGVPLRRLPVAGPEDIIVVSRVGDSVTFIANDGSLENFGIFPLPSGEGPTASVDADFNLDGLADIAVLNTDGDNILFLQRSLEQLPFEPVLSVPTSDFGPPLGRPRSLQASDVTLDGRVDLVYTVNQPDGPRGVRVIENSSFGGGIGVLGPFPVEVFSTTASAAQVLVDDVTGDGLPDIVGVSEGLPAVDQIPDLLVLINTAVAPLCPADVAVPFGVVDFHDVTAFINAFNGGVGLADIDRNGLLTFGDVSAFIDVFNDGCPPQP